MKHFISSASIAAMIACAFALAACANEPVYPLPPDVAGHDTQASQTAQTAQVAPPVSGRDIRYGHDARDPAFFDQHCFVRL